MKYEWGPHPPRWYAGHLARVRCPNKRAEALERVPEQIRDWVKKLLIMADWKVIQEQKYRDKRWKPPDNAPRRPGEGRRTGDLFK